MEVDAIAMLDLDQFKQINDVYGHQAGDDALRILVNAVTACVRNRNDALVRYGGDEFLLIFPHIPEHVFIKRLEQIRATVQALHMIEYPDLHLTVSIGGVYGLSLIHICWWRRGWWLWTSGCLPTTAISRPVCSPAPGSA